MCEKEQLLNALYRLYRLKDEGKNVDTLIAKYEAMLYSKVEEPEGIEGVYYSIEQDDFHYERGA